MNKLVVAACAALLAGCTTTPRDDGTLPGTLGGLLDPAYDNMINWEGPVRLTDRHYYSADTLWIGHPEACTVPETVFAFHSPHIIGTGLPIPNHRRLIMNWSNTYKEPLRTWFWETYKDYSPVKVLVHEEKTGKWMIDNGVLPECG